MTRAHPVFAAPLPLPATIPRHRLRVVRARKEIYETARDSERLSQVMLLAQARYLSAIGGLWLEQAQRARERGEALNIPLLSLLAQAREARRQYIRELAEAIAASRLVGRIRLEKQAASVSSLDVARDELPQGIRQFTETVPRNVALDKVIEHIRSLPALERVRWEEFVARHQQAAFTLGGVNDQEILGRLRDLVAESIRAGLTPDQFDHQARELLRAYQIDGRRLRLVWNDTVGDAIRQGRKDALADPEVASFLSWAIFDAINDNVVRPNHAALDNALAPVSWWDGEGNRYQPRLGFNCRCQLFYVSATRARKMLESSEGWNIEEQGVPEDAGPDPNFTRAFAEAVPSTSLRPCSGSSTLRVIPLGRDERAF